MIRASSTTLLRLASLTVLLGLGCGAAHRAAQRDPMACERDPKCDKRRSGVVDCSLQCVDDPACMERCEQVQQPNGGLGH